MVEPLLKGGTYNVNRRDSNGNTALVIANGRGQVDLIQSFLLYGGSVKDSTVGGLFGGKSCLVWASSQGCVEAVRLMIR